MGPEGLRWYSMDINMNENLPAYAPVLCFASTKGGVGKSSLTVFVLAHFAVEMKLRVVLLDLDEPQATAWSWCRGGDRLRTLVHHERVCDLRANGETVSQALERLTSSYDLVVMDVTGALGESVVSAVLNSDLVIVPFAAGCNNEFNSIEKCETVIARLSEQYSRKIDYRILINRAQVNTTAYRYACEFMDSEKKPRLQSVVRQLQDVSLCSNLYTAPAVWGSGRKSGAKARLYNDIANLSQEISSILRIQGGHNET